MDRQIDGTEGRITLLIEKKHQKSIKDVHILYGKISLWKDDILIKSEYGNDEKKDEELSKEIQQQKTKE